VSERKENVDGKTRSLLAAVLCLLVIAGWSLIYKPPQPPPGQRPPLQPQIPPRRLVAPAPSTSAPATGKSRRAPPLL